MQDEPLIGQKCEACHKGTPRLTREEAEAYLAQTPGWTLSKQGWGPHDGEKSIHRDFKFKNFMQALDFLNQVAKIAEAEGHHPEYSGGWGKLKLTLTTHAIKDLSKNDFILATKINALLP